MNKAMKKQSYGLCGVITDAINAIVKLRQI